MIALIDAMDKHRGAFEYDWRTRFGLSLDCIPNEMGWGEAFRMYEILSNDPSSHVCAAQIGWDYPLGRSETIALHQFDMINGALQGKKAKPYPHPWPDEDKATFKPKKARSLEEAREKFRRRREGAN